MSQDYLSLISTAFKNSIQTKEKILSHPSFSQTLLEIAEQSVSCILKGGKLMFCGNGGSAADAQHLAAELTIRLRSDVNRQALAAIPLATDISSLTACGNDYGFDDYFARMLQALGKPGDILVGISTSGQSPNVLKACHSAKENKITVVGFLGKDGGKIKDVCDLSLIVPSDITAHIQEAHITAGHILMVLIEEMLKEKNALEQR